MTKTHPVCSNPYCTQMGYHCSCCTLCTRDVVEEPELHYQDRVNELMVPGHCIDCGGVFQANRIGEAICLECKFDGKLNLGDH
jgi:hypothetical protein